MTTQLIPTDDEFAALGARILERTIAVDRRRKTHVAAGVGVAALATGGVATGWAVLGTAEQQRDDSYCYYAADLDADRAKIVSPPSIDGNTSTPQPNEPAEKCAALWRIGYFAENHHPTGKTEYTVPDLQACLMPDGVVGVFPRKDEDVCDALGLGSVD
jgi:hypothetical protein